MTNQPAAYTIKIDNRAGGLGHPRPWQVSVFSAVADQYGNFKLIKRSGAMASQDAAEKAAAKLRKQYEVKG